MKQDHDGPNPTDDQSETEPAVTSNLPDSLGELAREINGILEREAEVGTRFDDELNKEVEEHCRRCEDIALRKGDAIKDLRLEAGHLLIAAKTKVAPGEWRKWLRENIRRGVSDCYQCMKMAGADNPDKEREKEKADTRTRVQKHRDAKRAKAAKVSVTPPVTDTPPVNLPQEIVQNAPLRSSAPRGAATATETVTEGTSNVGKEKGRAVAFRRSCTACRGRGTHYRTHARIPREGRFGRGGTKRRGLLVQPIACSLASTQ